MVRRSVLFSPGDQPDLLAKAPSAGADVVVFDLEDAVVPEKKTAARESVADAVAEHSPACEICVRINPLESGGRADLQALSTPPDSVMLPKVERASDVSVLADALAEQAFDTPILALLETASGIVNATEIAAVPETSAVLFGAEDLSADIGATRTESGTEVLAARQQVVLAAASAGVEAIDTLVTDFSDTERLRVDAERAREWGFDGKMAIHPAQVSVINEAFTPTAEQVEWATRVVSAHERAQAEGRGVFSVDGEMIDAPLITQAETILERAEAAKQ